MKKLALLSLLTLILNGCSYIHTKEAYLDAQVANPLTIPDDVDRPNTTSALEIPPVTVKNTNGEKQNIAPPDMPIRTKQSQNGNVKIENNQGYPVLTVKTTPEYMWQAMSNMELENWEIASKDQDSCIVLLKYIDQEALERQEAGMFKKLFTRDSYYSDYSGEYKVACEQKGSRTVAKFSKKDGSVAKSFLADNVMTKLYEQFE